MPYSTPVKNGPCLPFPRASFRQRVHPALKVLVPRLRPAPAPLFFSSHTARNPPVFFGWTAFPENRSTLPKPGGVELLPFERMRKKWRLFQFHNYNKDDEPKAYLLKP